MKFITLNYLVILCSIFSLLIANSLSVSKSSMKKSTSHSRSKNRKKGINVIGESFTDSLNPNSDAITSAEAIVQYTPQTPGLTDVKIVNHLQDEILSPKGGFLEPIDEIPTPIKYYDGGLNLNKIEVNCQIYNTMDSCINNSNCGWCGNGQCMFGKSLSRGSFCAGGFKMIGGNQVDTHKYVHEPYEFTRTAIVKGFNN